MSSKTVSAICVAFLVIGLIGVVVAQSHATADQPAKVQGAPAIRPVNVEWPVLGLVLAGFGVFLLRPRKRATSSDKE